MSAKSNKLSQRMLLQYIYIYIHVYVLHIAINTQTHTRIPLCVIFVFYRCLSCFIVQTLARVSFRCGFSLLSFPVIWTGIWPTGIQPPLESNIYRILYILYKRYVHMCVQYLVCVEHVEPFNPLNFSLKSCLFRLDVCFVFAFASTTNNGKRQQPQWKMKHVHIITIISHRIVNGEFLNQFSVSYGMMCKQQFDFLLNIVVRNNSAVCSPSSNFFWSIFCE